MIDRGEPQVFDIGHQPPAIASDHGLAAGCAAQAVSIDPATGAYSARVRFPPGWRYDGRSDGATELFVLDGELTIAGERLSAASYCYLPPGTAAANCTCATGATAFVFWRPDSAIGVAGTVIRSGFEVPWESTVLPGFPAGAMHKSLRPADRAGEAHGGPDGFLRLVLTPPGWLSPREERHVGCWEENILLRGDMLMPGRGTLRAGDCLANPPGLWHGPMVTKGGALFLVNCDTPMRVEYRDHPPGAAELERYLETAPWA